MDEEEIYAKFAVFVNFEWGRFNQIENISIKFKSIKLMQTDDIDSFFFLLFLLLHSSPHFVILAIGKRLKLLDREQCLI